MSKPVYRYLTEQAWRENGDLGILVSIRVLRETDTSKTI